MLVVVLEQSGGSRERNQLLLEWMRERWSRFLSFPSALWDRRVGDEEIRENNEAAGDEAAVSLAAAVVAGLG